MTDKPNIQFSDKTSTQIWKEEPCSHNPYVAEVQRLYGYDTDQLIGKKSYVDVLFLLFSGELPNTRQSALLERLMIFLINPGPRHPATQAAMVAAISKTRPAHILPIGSILMGGECLGFTEVARSMDYIAANIGREPSQLREQEISSSINSNSQEGDCYEGDCYEGNGYIVPGFGTYYGDVDPVSEKFIARLGELCGPAIHWGKSFVSPQERVGWLKTGVAAAAMLDLGMSSRKGAGLFQLLSMPGILAHGIEQSHKHFTKMPQVSDENYTIES